MAGFNDLIISGIRDSHNINMALHKSQRTKNFNPGLMEGFNIVFFFSFVNNIGNKLPGPFIPACPGCDLACYIIIWTVMQWTAMESGESAE
jgi:hypothetical protein